ncbi:hypothetical protein HMPREF0080_00500 [Anaeroglobus geminatus F0357]|uniref:Uncharacterized protein n=1 Tax=Anaeroglobus geminatus F0357 TaxID=861450 RepID=G9YFT7_9FIRM|nr:hypothetical protein HMPREF0080_00500 [Anaeroglobus geminatus F0357]
MSYLRELRLSVHINIPIMKIIVNEIKAFLTGILKLIIKT